MYVKGIWCYIVTILLLATMITTVDLCSKTRAEEWSDDIRLTFTDERSAAPSIAVEGDNVHVVWSEKGKGIYYEYHLWYISSNDGGETWNPPVCLANDSFMVASGAKIAANGNYVHIIWHDSCELFYIQSRDDGNTWSNIIKLPVWIYTGCENTDIVVYENYVHIVFADINRTICYIRSTDYGITWEQLIRPVPSYDVYQAVICVYRSNVHIAYQYTNPPNHRGKLLYIKSENNGEIWESAINVTEPIINGTYYVDIAVNKENIYIVYRGDDIWQIYLSYSTDNGYNWVKNIQLSDSSATYGIHYPSVATHKNRIYVTWKDNRDRLNRIYYKYSHDGGNSWNEDTQLTNFSSSFPHIDIERNVVHFVWEDKRHGEGEIYYKRLTTSVSPVEPSIDIDPDTLNLKSKGQWITAYIELNEYYDVNDIDISSILLENCIPAELHPSEIGDYDNDGNPDLMVKFDRAEVEDILTVGESVTITVTGTLFDGNPFEGSDTIRVIEPQ